jgi:ABC-type antimicrobial peptide transport system permease subunit
MKKNQFIKNLFTPFHRVNKAAVVITTAVALIVSTVAISQGIAALTKISVVLWILPGVFSLPTMVALLFVCYCVAKEMLSFICGIRYLFH